MANNVNVSFLKGTQTNFNALTSYVEGAFYLTTDTHRLYFADSTKTANYLNKYVHTVSATSEITTAYTEKKIVVGDFVYVSSLNALVVITENGGYKQINAYKNTDTVADSVTFSKDTSKDDEVVFTFTLNQIAYDLEKKAAYGDSGAESQLQPDAVTGTFTITASDIKEIIKTAVDVNATISGTTATVKTSGTGSSGDGFTITGAGSVVVGGSNDKITITGTNTKYDLSSPANETIVHLVGNDGSDDEVEFTAGKQIALDGATAGNIKIAHGTVGTTHTDNATAQSVADNMTFKAINAITTDNGHITGYTTQTYKLPTRAKYEVTGIDANNTGDLTVTIKDANSGHESEFTAEKEFYYTVGKADKYKKVIYNQNELDVYTATEIDEKLKGVNAMVYRGTVGSGGTLTGLPSTNVSIGDTYKVVSEGTYNGLAGCEVGDIFIATIASGSVEDANGYIPSGKIVWTYIPSGDDYDAQFSFVTNAASNMIALGEDAFPNKDKGTITFTSTNNGGIEISTTASGDKNQDATVAIEHKSYSTSEEEATATASTAGSTFSAITGVTTDKGHLTKYTTTTFTLPPDRDSKYGLGAASGSTNQGKIVLTGSGSANGQEDIVTVIGSTDIEITTNADSDTITLKHGAPKSHGSNTDKNASTTSATGSVTTNSTTGVTTIQALTGIKLNSTGHVLSAEKSTFTLPADSQYTFEDKAELRTVGSSKGFKWSNEVTGKKGANGQSSSFNLSLVSSSLNITTNASNNASTGDFILDIDLVWGSF